MKTLIRILRKISLLHSVNLIGRYPPDKAIKIPIIRSLGYDHLFEPEPWLVILLRRILEPLAGDACFIDVGVNLGQTLLKVRSISRSISYIGFEPNPNCLFYLYELIHINNFQNVTIFPFALSDNNGIIDLDFYGNGVTDSSASIVPGFRGKCIYKIKVPVFSAASISQLGASKLGVVKIDVEGGELDVIKGMLTLIQRDRPIIICEVLPVYNVVNTLRLVRQEELESILKNASYEIARIDNAGMLHGTNSIGVHSDISRANYLFFPLEKRETLGLNIHRF